MSGQQRSLDAAQPPESAGGEARIPPVRQPKDRDFIETEEGLIFCVVGDLHPPEKIIAYLKYIPQEGGRWQREGRGYRRALAYYHAHQVGLTLHDLKARFPHYVHYCPVNDMEFSMVPQDRIRTYYQPEQRLAEIMNEPGDELEAEAARAAAALSQAAGIPTSALGVTGSILLGTHNLQFSDINLTVYGSRNAVRLRQGLQRGAVPGAARLDEAYADDWRRRMVRHFHLTPEQARWLVAQQWNYIRFGAQQILLTIHPGPADAEIRETYGDHIYRDAGIARLQATIHSAAEAVFMPSLYSVKEAVVLEGPPVEVREVLSYEGIFRDIVAAGQKVTARGKLERVDAGPWHRLVIGSSRQAGPEYLLPLER